nr:hypothetical protein [Tanacetum cinerariifolium]
MASLPTVGALLGTGSFVGTFFHTLVPTLGNDGCNSTDQDL